MVDHSYKDDTQMEGIREATARPEVIIFVNHDGIWSRKYNVINEYISECSDSEKEEAIHKWLKSVYLNVIRY